MFRGSPPRHRRQFARCSPQRPRPEAKQHARRCSMRRSTFARRCHRVVASYRLDSRRLPTSRMFPAPESRAAGLMARSEPQALRWPRSTFLQGRVERPVAAHPGTAGPPYFRRCAQPEPKARSWRGSWSTRQVAWTSRPARCLIACIPLFAAAVRSASARMRCLPATARNTRVAPLIQQSFQFRTWRN